MNILETFVGIDYMCEAVGWTLGKVADEILNKIRATEPQVEAEIIKAVDSAFETMFDRYEMVWNPKVLKEYLKDNKDITVDDLLYMTNEDIKEMMARYPKEEANDANPLETKMYKEAFEKITQEWKTEWFKVCMQRMANSESASNYMMLYLLVGQQELVKQREKDYEELVYAVKRDIDECRNTNMYDNLTMINRTVFPYVANKLKVGCSDIVLELGYALTDIYDHVSEYDKTTTLANLILDMIDKSNDVYSKKQLQTLIGCTYSLTITKGDSLEHKEGLLEEAKKRFDRIDQYLQKWLPNDNADYYFIKGLFESNVGAWYTNMSDLEKKKGNDEASDEYLELALEHQRKGEENRQRFFDIYRDSLNREAKEEAEKRLYQSKSNIAGILYRLGQLDDALFMHKEVLAYRNRTEKQSDAVLSLEYISGVYIEKWKLGAIENAQKKECKEYLELCKEYYHTNGDEHRKKSIQEKIDKLTELEKKDADKDKDKENNPNI